MLISGGGNQIVHLNRMDNINICKIKALFYNNCHNIL